MSIDTSTNVDIDLESLVNPYEDTDDGNEHLTHIINPKMNQHLWSPGITVQEMVDSARMTGAKVNALCGYSFVPKRNPEKYPACQSCMDVAGAIMRGKGQ